VDPEADGLHDDHGHDQPAAALVVVQVVGEDAAFADEYEQDDHLQVDHVVGFEKPPAEKEQYNRHCILVVVWRNKATWDQPGNSFSTLGMVPG